MDLNSDRDPFDGWTVLKIDEAGTLGAAQARELLERARAAGARVMLLGDISQHDNTIRWKVEIDVEGDTLTCEVIDYRQEPNLAAVV